MSDYLTALREFREKARKGGGPKRIEQQHARGKLTARERLEEDFESFLLMHAMGANAAGQIASVVAGGVILALMGAG